MLRFLLPVAALFFIVPGLAAAAPERMHCELSKGEPLVNQFFFEFDEARDAARLVDGIILKTHGKPIPVEVSENSAKKLTMRWSVAMVNNRGQQTRMSFRAAVQKNNNRVIVYAKPHGYRNNFIARGRCQRMQGELPSS